MIHEALRLIRIFHDLKQTELADKLQVSKSCISEIESGKRQPTFDLITKYSEVFSMPVSSIMFFAEELPNAKKGEKIRVFMAKKAIDILKFIEKKSNYK